MMQGAASMDTDELYFPSKHPGSDSHLMGISSEAMARSRPIESCRPACFWTRSVWPKPDTVSQNQTGSRLILHKVIQAVCWRMQLSLTVGDCSRPFVFCQNRAWWFLDTGLLLDQMCLAKTWPGHPDWIWASFAQYDPDLLYWVIVGFSYCFTVAWLPICDAVTCLNHSHRHRFKDQMLWHL